MNKPRWNLIKPLSDELPTSRWGHSTCLYQNGIAIFGGYSGIFYLIFRK